MRPRITLNTFRRIDRIEEQMIRAAMPRTSAADPEPLAVHAAPTQTEVVARRSGSRLVRPLTATIAEVVRG